MNKLITTLILSISMALAQPSSYDYKALTPPGPLTVTAQAIGQAGANVYYYWVITNYPLGVSNPAGPAVVYNAPNTLSGSNYVRVSWTQVSGASSYTVIRGTTPNLPSSGLIGLSGNPYSTTTLNDIGTALISYTVSGSIQPAVANVRLDNAQYYAPTLVSSYGLDLSAGPVTKPNYLGAGAPTAACQVGQTYQRSDAAELYICYNSGGGAAWALISGSGGGVTAVNCMVGLTCTTLAGVVTITPETTNVLLTKGTYQAGTPSICNSASASTTFTCTLSPTLIGYTAGMTIQFRPSVTALGGASTLNIDGLGAIAIKQYDGATDPTASTVAIGGQITLAYDGTVFRLLAGGGVPATGFTLTNGSRTSSFGPQYTAVPYGGGLIYANSLDASNPVNWDVFSTQYGGSGTNEAGVESYSSGLFSTWKVGALRLGGTTAPTCNSTNRGKLFQVYGGAGVKDLVEVCTKDAADVYAYRPLYSATFDTTLGVQVLGQSTVAALPTCNSGSNGTLRGVTDALAPAYNAVLVGGGAVITVAYCNGTNWTAH